MVQLNTSIYWLIAVLAIPCSCASVNDITNGINSLLTKVTTLVNLWDAIPDSGLVILTDAANLISSVHDIKTTIDQVTSDLQTVTVAQSASSVPGVFSQLQGLEPSFVSVMNSAVTKKPAFNSLPPVSPVSARIILIALISLNMSTTNLEKALEAKAPANIVSAGQNLQKDLDAAFANAIQTYKS